MASLPAYLLPGRESPAGAVKTGSRRGRLRGRPEQYLVLNRAPSAAAGRAKVQRGGAANGAYRAHTYPRPVDQWEGFSDTTGV